MLKLNSRPTIDSSVACPRAHKSVYCHTHRRRRTPPQKITAPRGHAAASCCAGALARPRNRATTGRPAGKAWEQGGRAGARERAFGARCFTTYFFIRRFSIASRVRIFPWSCARLGLDCGMGGVPTRRRSGRYTRDAAEAPAVCSRRRSCKRPTARGPAPVRSGKRPARRRAAAAGSLGDSDVRARERSTAPGRPKS